MYILYLNNMYLDTYKYYLDTYKRYTSYLDTSYEAT